MAQQSPMTRQQFIASFKPQFRDKVTAMYDQYQRTHKMPSVGKQTAKAVAKDSIPWVAIPTVMAAILRRGMYNTPGQVWGSTKVIGGTALAASILHAAFKAPGEYQNKKRSVPQDYAAAAQDHILTQLQKNAAQAAPGTPTQPAQQKLASLQRFIPPHLRWSIPLQVVQPITAGAAKRTWSLVQRAASQPRSQQQQQQVQQAAATIPTSPQRTPQTPTPAQNTSTTAPVTQAGGTWDNTKKYVQQATGDLAQAGKNALGSVFLPGATGDRSRMYALGGIGLLLALMSGGGLGRALLFTALGAGLGYAANKWLLPNVSGWSTAANRLNSIKDTDTRKKVQRSAIDGGFNYVFGGNPRNAGSVQQAITEQIVQDQFKDTELGNVEFKPNNTVTVTPTNKNMPAVTVGNGVKSAKAPTRRKRIDYSRG